MEEYCIITYPAFNGTRGWAAGVVPKFPGQLYQGPEPKFPSGLHQGVYLPWKLGELERTSCSVPIFHQETRLMCSWSTRVRSLEELQVLQIVQGSSLPDSPSAGTERMKYAFLFCL